MKTKYIIEVEDKPFELLSEDGFTSEKLYRVKGFNSLVFDWNGLNMLTPYTEPEPHTEVTADAYQRGYEAGLNDAWEAARKIYDISQEDRLEIFPEASTFVVADICDRYSASECVEKIRQYEQEKDRQARIEYNFDEIKDVLETTAKECNVSLDEIAEVLRKMGETNNG